jgi:hypothetical protein
MDNLQKDLIELKECVFGENGLCKLYKELKDDVKEIKEKLLGRPSWWVVGLISGLFTITGILLTICLKN